MARHSRYRDVSTAGSSDIVPYRRGEDAANRHQRRLYINLKLQGEVKGWAKANKIDLQIKNDGHHWIFKFHRSVAEWWPSSAKLVFNRAYEAGIHVHDYKQLMKELTEKWNLNVKAIITTIAQPRLDTEPKLQSEMES